MRHLVPALIIVMLVRKQRIIRGEIVRICDLGAGLGYLELFITHLCQLYRISNIHIIAIDVQPKLMEVYRSYLSHSVYSRCDFMIADGRMLPIRDRSIHILAILEVLEHISYRDRVTLLAEIARLARGKRLCAIISVPHDILLAKVLDPAILVGHKHFSHKKLTTILLTFNFKPFFWLTYGGPVQALAMILLYIVSLILKSLNLNDKRVLSFLGKISRICCKDYLRIDKKGNYFTLLTIAVYG